MRGAEPTQPRWIYFALIGAVVIAYATSFVGQFQFDDWNVIVNDARVQSLRAWWDSMPGIRPLLKLSYALNWQSGLGLMGFHAVNVALHAANTCLVYSLTRRVAGREDSHTWAGARTALPLAVALFFAWHPVQTEAVTYLSGRSTALAAFFCLASLIAWIDGRNERRNGLVLAASPLLFALALGVKEFAVALPAAMLLWAVTDRSFRATRDSLTRLARDLVPTGFVLLAAFLAATSLPRYVEFATDSLGVRGPLENLGVQVHAIVYLLGQALLPWQLNADPMLEVVPELTATTLLKGTFLALGVVWGLVNLRRSPSVSFGILWFFVWLAPTNSFVARLDVVNDRQLYLPLLGIAWLLALGWTRLSPTSRPKILVVLFSAFAVMTASHNLIYSSEIEFWTATTRASPHNARAATNLGYAYVLADRPAEAEQEFVRALSIDPHYTRAAVNLLLLRNGTLQERNPE